LKKLFLILFTIHFPIAIGTLFASAQDIPPATEQQLENQTDADQAETEDDSYLLELEGFRKNPINLNTAEADELKQLRMVTGLQIESLLFYRNLFGKLISIYELQAVPAWDINTIRKLLPFITVTSPLSLTAEARRRFSGGEHSLVLRVSQILERSDGFDKSTPGTKYLGSPQRLLLRYRYTYKNLLQFGIIGDKDAGEQFFRGTQNKGFDFYSFHFFARKIGIIQALAVGDFTINLGQGLIQWQGLAFKKSVDVMGVKRQSAVLRPYSSSGEFYFNRGAGITIKKGPVEATGFISIRKLSANFVADTVSSEEFISSFLNSGYHRTASEVENRNNLTQTSFGGNIRYQAKRWHIGFNSIHYHFSMPVQKRDEPYNLYAISGDHWNNFSVDYSYTYKNLHFFGEAAADKNFHKAFINGLLISVDRRVDLSLVQRTIRPQYQSVNGNAFTENTYPTNETGFYLGAAIRPGAAWRLDAYGDIYKFPWLKYGVDAPSHGMDFLIQLTYTPNKQVEVYTKFRIESKQANQPGNATMSNYLVTIPRQNWRMQVTYKINTTITLRNRVELLWYDHKGINKENGFLAFFDFIYKPMMSAFSGVCRLQYFETNGYNSRIYAYENDVLYGYSIPAFFDKGYRYYFTLNYDLNKKISCWLRWAQTIYKDQNSIGSGLEEIRGNKKSEVELEFRWLF
jgi:Helix-hairpin-helix motif